MLLDFCSHFVKGMEVPFACISSSTGFNHNTKLNPMSRSEAESDVVFFRMSQKTSGIGRACKGCCPASLPLPLQDTGVCLLKTVSIN